MVSGAAVEEGGAVAEGLGTRDALQDLHTSFEDFNLLV